MCHDVMWHMAPADDEDIPSLSQYPTLSPRSSAPVSPLQLQLHTGQLQCVEQLFCVQLPRPQQLTHPRPQQLSHIPHCGHTAPALFTHLRSALQINVNIENYYKIFYLNIQHKDMRRLKWSEVIHLK